MCLSTRRQGPPSKEAVIMQPWAEKDSIPLTGRAVKMTTDC